MISFFKMQGTGNDFIIVNTITEKFRFSYWNLAKFLCNRKFGVGADGVIFLEKGEKAEYKMRIFNQDGSEAGMCGNGIRCLAKYLYEKNLCSQTKFVIETLSGNKEVELIVENKTVIGVKVDMGEASLGESLQINIDGKIFNGYKVDVGNPHFVCFMNELSIQELEKYGSIIENYKYFPEKTNVEFVKVLNLSRIEMLVWERGVGRTSSCGTGACASAVASCEFKSTNTELIVDLEGGKLRTIYNKENKKINLIGNCEFVYEGKINL